jgi:sugar phosphate isomerase/epimerase
MATPTRLGVDLITFYHPQFWNVESYENILELADKDPLAVWTRILDSVAEAGVSRIEMTFPPADWHSAIAAYGSAKQFGNELARRGLGLKSGFHLGLDWTTDTDRQEAADSVCGVHQRRRR